MLRPNKQAADRWAKVTVQPSERAQEIAIHNARASKDALARVREEAKRRAS